MEITPVTQALAEQKLIFFDPALKNWTTAEEYLSGDLKRKLALARSESEASDLDPWILASLERNVQALEQVQPLPVLPPATPEIKARCAFALGVNLEGMTDGERLRLMQNTIEVQLGVTWVSPEVYQEFLLHLLGVETRVGYVSYGSTWSVTGRIFTRTSFCTGRRTALDLMEQGLNQKDPLVYDLDADGNRVLNAPESEAARAMLGKIRQAFKAWLWTDRERAEALCRIYNERFNSWQVRQFNGAHLTLPGSNPAIQLKPHQKNGVWRILQNPATLLAWEVGAGKTFAMIAAAMEARRLGLAHKPMLVVLNSTLPQIAADFRKLYPLAKLLVADQESFTKEQRRVFLCQIATGDWDCIILTHTQFFALPLSPETELRFLQTQKDQIADLLQGLDDRTSAKALETAKRNLEGRIFQVTQSTRKDQVIYWEQLGVQMLILDEAQAFKNLRFYTRQRGIAGMSNAHSQRAQDTFMKIQHLLGSGGRVVFATGTPLSNTMAELFTLQRFLDLDYLQHQGLENFDSWAAQYGETVTAPEISPTGKYKVRTRFAQFINVPELLMSFMRFADIQTAEKLGLERPEAVYVNESAPPTEDLGFFMDRLVVRAERVQNRMVEPEVDNMLKITHHGRLACLDMRLVWGEHNPPLLTKVHQAIWNIWQIWKATRHVQGTQLVFLDLSTPGPKWNVYDYLKNFLILLDIPTEQIAYIHEYDNEQKRRSLFEQVNQGQVRILLGSTQKLGTGVNVQQRLIAIHHLDAPWRPSDLEQREGRILRQGNRWPKGWVFRYVTEGKQGQCGFDAFLWQILQVKKAFIDRIMQGDLTERKAEDIAATTLNYNQVKALATGDPIIQEKANLEQKLRQLHLLKAAWENGFTRRHWEVRTLRETLSTLPSRITPLKQDLATIHAHDPSGDKFSLTINGKTFTDRKKAGSEIWRLSNTQTEWLGKFAGLRLEPSYLGKSAEIVLKGQGPAFYTHITETPLGTVMALQNCVVREFPQQLEDLQQRLIHSQQKLARIEAQPHPLWEQAEELAQVQGRLAEIEQQLSVPEELPEEQEDKEEEAATDADEGPLAKAEGEAAPPDEETSRLPYQVSSIPSTLVQALKDWTREAPWRAELEAMVGIPETLAPAVKTEDVGYKFVPIKGQEDMQQGCLF
ncbi:helicase-related protein [Anthocerotibacter panamensis]|uniref:helicase-related protein n=1 Tax=Anthocerotibacter panamensis TaxID=2857077 RepID=UPI001C401BC5|nr:helicase-related protein [Anthocerotibacter panamensis]